MTSEHTLHKNTATSHRDSLPDILRGFAVCLMVFGHCIQEGSGRAFRIEALYFQDRLYQFIYSFHMPLFMLLSGYLAWGSMKRADTAPKRLALLKRRIPALLLPIALWTLFEKIYAFTFNIRHGYPNQPFPLLLQDYLFSFLNNFWFLWAVLWCFLIVFIMHYYLHDSKLLYALGFLALFVLPDGMGLGAYKYMMPYYISAFYLHRYLESRAGLAALPDNRIASPANPRMEKSPALKRCPGLLLCSGLLFFVLFLFYDEKYFIYLSGYKLIGKDIPTQLFIDFYRMFIGFAGSLFFILLFALLQKRFAHYQFPVLSLLGRDSLGIYLTSGYLTLFGIVRFSDLLPASYLRNLGETILVLTGSVLLTEILKRIPILKWLVGRLK